MLLYELSYTTNSIESGFTKSVSSIETYPLLDLMKDSRVFASNDDDMRESVLEDLRE